MTGETLTTLASTATASVALTTFEPTQTGTYSLSVAAQPSETDALPATNTMTGRDVIITNNEPARHDGALASIVGIGAEVGEMGVIFDIPTRARVTAVRAIAATTHPGAKATKTRRTVQPLRCGGPGFCAGWSVGGSAPARDASGVTSW